MATLDLAPAIAAIRARPEEFEFAGGGLRHLPSRHTFRFSEDGDVNVDADCYCASLRTSREQGRVFQAAFKEWHTSYWRVVTINREFASHFEPPGLWRRLAVRLLTYLLSRPPHLKTDVQPAMPRASVF
jgi:hypothetical protein